MSISSSQARPTSDVRISERGATPPHASRVIALLLPLLLLSPTFAAFGVTNSLLPRVADPRLDSALSRTWRGLVKTNIAPWSDGLLHRPNSEMPGDAVSEGQAYAMILALYANDQATFNKVWDAAEKNLWNEKAGYYDWRWNDGAVVSGGMATDADQDIALMLLFADSLVKKGMWTAHKSPNSVDYKTRALALIKTLWTSAVSGKFNLAPGAGWGGDGFVNPGYYSPASYRIFAKYDPGHDWLAVVNQCYAVLARNPGIGKGLVPDWMVPDGKYFDGSLGYNAYREGRSLYKDAIRIHWRLALDWLWFGEARAKAFLDSAAAFVRTPDRANFYTMDGEVVPATDTFTLGNGMKRSRQEYSELTLGMWACAAFASKGSDSVGAWVDSLMAFAPEGATGWGRPSDSTLPDRNGSVPNEQYFEQFLAWFGTAVLAGRFSNILDDLDDPNPSLPLDWLKQPSATPVSVDFQDGPYAFSALLNKAANWNVSIQAYPNGAIWNVSGRSDSINVAWNGFDAGGKPFPQGWCLVTVSPRGLAQRQSWVWLSHHRDIRLSSDWIIVDDFSSSSLAPNVGAWSSFNNSSNGGTAKVGPLAPSGTGTDRSLTYTYDLGENGYQYCGLSWESNNWASLPATSRIRYRAKADHKTVMDLYLVQSDIGDDNYFHVLDTITTSWKTFEHAYSTLTGRLASRSGSPDLTKTTAMHWHIQADKCIDSKNCVVGNITIDDVHFGGDVSKMVSAPADALPMPASPPYTGVAKRRTISTSLRMLRSASGRVVLSAAPGTRVTWLDLSGRERGRSQADAEGRILWNASDASGIVLARPDDGTPALPVVLR